jgi:SAM-dependent methyltransferase
MSDFSSVDSANDPAPMLRYLDYAAECEAGMQHYVVAAHALRRPTGPLLDVGCGAGHDLDLLTSAGLTAVGVDPSAVMIHAARQRVAAGPAKVARAIGEELPFADGSFSGVHIERVLMHVPEPRRVVAEAVRCLVPGGLVTIFEPDWGSFRVRGEGGDQLSGWIAGMRHPDVGGQLWDLLEEVGCSVSDRVEELSVWRSLRVLQTVINLDASITRAVSAGRIGADGAARWLDQQQACDRRGAFVAMLPKILVVAVKEPAT